MTPSWLSDVGEAGRVDERVCVLLDTSVQCVMVGTLPPWLAGTEASKPIVFHPLLDSQTLQRSLIVILPSPPYHPPHHYSPKPTNRGITPAAEVTPQQEYGG